MVRGRHARRWRRWRCAAKARGYSYLAVTDHSHYLREGRLEAQAKELAALNAKLKPFRLLHGVEVNIRANGTLDVPDETLAGLDWVVASIHAAFGTSPTERVIAAMENPHVDVIGHLTGRKINKRAPMDIDLERVFAAAVETGTALEINSQPDRLDLRDADARLAGERGRADRHLDRRALDRGARLRAARDRHGPPRVADEGPDREHAAVVEGQGEEVMPFREDGHRAVDWAADYLERVGELPVLAQVKPGDIRARLPASPPEQPEPFEAVLRDLDEILLPGVTHWQHPRFFAYFSVSGAEPGILAELLAATLNSVGFLWRTAPASTELELRRLRLGGAAARPPDRLARAHRGHGIDLDARGPHRRSAQHGPERRGLPRSTRTPPPRRTRGCSGWSSRSAPTDDEFRMRPDALELDDVAVVVATVGTTSVASVDPVAEIADRCAAAGAWLHVDAAYAGSAMVCPELRWAFDGVERADSLVVNAHKWMFTPMDCSLLWTSRPAEFRDAFSLVPEFLRTTDEGELNLSEYGPALGRRFRSLKLWAILRCYGAEGLRARIREAIRLAELFEGWVRRRARLGAVRAAALLARLLPQGGRRRGERGDPRAGERERRDLHLAHEAHGRYVLRLAIGNERTTEDDVRRAWDVLRDLS